MVEAACAAAFGVVAAYLLMFAARPRAGTRRPGSARRLFVAAVVGCAAVPAGRCTAGSGGTGGWSSSRGCSRRKHPQDRRPAARHHRAGPQRLRAGPLAGALRGGDPRRSPRTPQSRDFRDAVPEPAASALGRASLAVPVVARDRPVRGLPGRGRATPGRGSSRPGATRRATRSPRSSRCPTGWSSPTASRSRVAGQARRRHRLAARREATARLGDQPPVAAPLADGRYEFEPARRRSTPAGSTSGSATPRSGSGSSRRSGPS